MDASTGLIQYTLILDNSPFPDLPDTKLQLSARPDPTGFTLVTLSVQRRSNSSFVKIEVGYYYCCTSILYVQCVQSQSMQGTNLDSVEIEEITVTIGGQQCVISSVVTTETPNQVSNHPNGLWDKFPY